MVKSTLDWIIDNQSPDGNFSSTYEDPDDTELVHWCHGATGTVMLLITAYTCFEEERVLKVSLDITCCMVVTSYLRRFQPFSATVFLSDPTELMEKLQSFTALLLWLNGLNWLKFLKCTVMLTRGGRKESVTLLLL